MSNLKPVKTAVIGSGNISYTYMNSLTSLFSIVDLVGCSDLVPEKSKARSEMFGIRQMTTEQILEDKEIEIVLNLTQIFNHTSVTKMILDAGKNAYSEKVIGCSFEEAKANADLAKSKGLRIGAAPDIYLGAAYQTARKLIDDGWIGDPISAHAFCIRAGGRGYTAPMAFNNPNMGKQGTTMPYDMGGYYINALVALLGPVNRVSGYSRRYAGPGKYMNPAHPNYLEATTPSAGASTVMGCLEFENGCLGNLMLCSDGFGPELPRVEIYGTLGTLILPDPNGFGGYPMGGVNPYGGDVYMSRIGNDGLFKVPFSHAYGDTDPAIPTKTGRPVEACHNSNRGLAVADMAFAIRRNRPHRSSAELAIHTVEILDAIETASTTNQVVTLTTHPERPAALPHGFIGAHAEAALDS